VSLTVCSSLELRLVGVANNHTNFTHHGCHSSDTDRNLRDGGWWLASANAFVTGGK